MNCGAEVDTYLTYEMVFPKDDEGNHLKDENMQTVKEILTEERPHVDCNKCNNSYLLANIFNKIHTFALYGEVCCCCGESRPEFLLLLEKDDDTATFYQNNCSFNKYQCHDGIRTHLLNRIVDHALDEDYILTDKYIVKCFNCSLSQWRYGYCPHKPDSFKEIELNKKLTSETTWGYPQKLIPNKISSLDEFDVITNKLKKFTKLTVEILNESKGDKDEKD